MILSGQIWWLRVAAISAFSLMGLFAPQSAAAQASIQGIVVENDNGQPLYGALVSLEGAQSRSSLTDRNGFYQFGGLPAGTYALRVTYVGYLQHQATLVLTNDDRITASVRLSLDPLALQGIAVSSTRGGAAQRELGRQQITPGDLRLVPVPAGSGDVASYLQTLPGVVSTGDRGGQLFIRGGTAAENLSLIDGLIIYQPFHILGFFSAFPEDLVSNVDFYAGGFGARYNGRTSSVLDVQLRDGDFTTLHGQGSISPFLVEGTVEGPIPGGGASFLASTRRSVIDQTSSTFVGSKEPLNFESQYLKLSTAEESGSRCSALAVRTADSGLVDAADPQTGVGWKNLVLGGRCVMLLPGNLRYVEVNFGYSSVENSAASRGASDFVSKITRIQNEAHTATTIGSTPLEMGYYLYSEKPSFDLSDLFNVKQENDVILNFGGYVETTLPLGARIAATPGLVVTLSPHAGLEPRLRAGWKPFGRESEQLQGALGLYRQSLTGLSDSRDVRSVFTAWTEPPGGNPMEAIHWSLGWQQQLPSGLQWSLEGYQKRITHIPVPEWRSTAQFNTRLTEAEGEVAGVDTRIEYRRQGFFGYVGYGYSRTRYQVSQDEFENWFGEPTQEYSPPHDRTHSVNALVNIDVGKFNGGARWQLGTGLPFTQPLGFEEAFDFRTEMPRVLDEHGTTRMIVDRPFGGRLPDTHRLDVWIERAFPLRSGSIQAQLGVVNAYNRQNLFYYDLFTGRRSDQLPFAPYFSLRFSPP